MCKDCLLCNWNLLRPNARNKICFIRLFWLSWSTQNSCYSRDRMNGSGAQWQFFQCSHITLSTSTTWTVLLLDNKNLIWCIIATAIDRISFRPSQYSNSWVNLLSMSVAFLMMIIPAGNIFEFFRIQYVHNLKWLRRKLHLQSLQSWQPLQLSTGFLAWLKKQLC